MKALVLTGKNEPLAFQEIDNPVASDGEVIVSLKAAALNHRDLFIQKGLYAGIIYPMVIGSDGSGVLENGKEVIICPSMFWGEDPNYQGKNHQILGLPTYGTFAEKIKIQKEYIFPKPKDLSFEQAAAIPLAGLTAYRALFTKCKIKAGDRVLISGIGGGVALFALQFALAAGCEVWVTSGSEEKIAKAVTLGAKGGVNYKTEGWGKEFNKITGGFDAIVDGAAGPGVSEFVKVCKSGARICFYGGTAGPISGVSPQILFYKQIVMLGSTMGTPEEFEKMLELISKHKIIPVVDEVFNLSEGNSALQRMDTGQQFGKIILKMN